MQTGLGGTFVLTADQTTLDGAPALRGFNARVGQSWRWMGRALRLDTGQPARPAGQPAGPALWRETIAAALSERDGGATTQITGTGLNDALTDGFIVSDGITEFTLVPISLEGSAWDLIWCPNGVPAADQSYTVVDVAPDAPRPRRAELSEPGGVICFTAGTHLRTPTGTCRVEDLRPGDLVQTRDNGPQEVCWIGSRHLTGARLYAMPALRPVRIRADAVSAGVPDVDLLVSPDHRMLHAGPRAAALFNTQEVLLRARDMVDDRRVLVDHSLREVTYFHVMFEGHQLIWANNMATESFHPAHMPLEAIAPAQRATLLARFPELQQDAGSYGPLARRNLSKPEAAILLYDQI